MDKIERWSDDEVSIWIFSVLPWGH